MKKVYPWPIAKFRNVIFLMKPLLLFLSFIYFMLILMRRVLYRIGIFRAFKLDAKVISIGNITTGGTGKTPLLILLADFLDKNEKRVTISSRGYGGDYVKKGIILDGSIGRLDNLEFLGDEAHLLKKYLPDIPLLIGRDRIGIIRRAFKKNKPDILILDDGFQHVKVKRDLDIVTVNALNPFGNYNLIPCGILREPLSSLGHADIFVITKADLADDITPIKDSLKKINPKAVITCSQHLFKGLYEFEKSEGIDKSSLKDKNTGTICAIGDPDSFERLLRKEGFIVKINSRFIDHHIFAASEIESFINRCLSEGIDTVITTEKDIFRLKDFLYIFKGVNIKLVFAGIELKLTENKEAFFERISVLFNN